MGKESQPPQTKESKKKKVSLEIETQQKTNNNQPHTCEKLSTNNS